MKALKFLALPLIALIAIWAYFSLFIVQQTEQALVLEFGKMKRVVAEPGLHMKRPWYSVVYFDKRLLEVDSEPDELIVRDQGQSALRRRLNAVNKTENKKIGNVEFNRLTVDTFTRYKITDPVRFYRTVGTTSTARNRISSIVNNALREVLSKSTLEAVVRDNRSGLMNRVAELVRNDVKEFGINIVDVRFKRTDFPKENQEGVFQDMRTNFQAEADEYRGQGVGGAQTIKENANLYVEETKSGARRTAEIIRGGADAQRANIFAKYLGQDPEFYAFYRSMQAYEKGLASKDTRLVISPDSPFFKYFKQEK